MIGAVAGREKDMGSRNIRFFPILFAVAVIMFLAGLMIWQKRAEETPQTAIPIEEIFSTSYSCYLYETGFPLPDVCWEYITSPGRLETLQNDYCFEYPDNLDLENNSYVVSFGCKIIECWTDGVADGEAVLNVVYDNNYQGKTLFLYQLPKVKIYPLDWPSYILKDGKRITLATTPTNCDRSLLDGYEFYVEFPMKEFFSAFYTECSPKAEDPTPNVHTEYVCSEEQLKALAAKYSFLYPYNLDLDNHSYLISFGHKITGCWSEKIEEGEYVLNISQVSEYVGEQVFFYQFPKFLEGK